MRRKRKTPPLILDMMKRQQVLMRHVDEVLRVKRTVPLENQMTHVREKSEDYWIGLADGHNTMLENMMLEYNCYAGFQNQGCTPVVLESGDSFYPWVDRDDPEYAGWRRVYFARD